MRLEAGRGKTLSNRPSRFHWLSCRPPQTTPCFEENLESSHTNSMFNAGRSFVTHKVYRVFSPSWVVGWYLPSFTPCLWLLSTQRRHFSWDLLHILLPLLRRIDCPVLGGHEVSFIKKLITWWFFSTKVVLNEKFMVLNFFHHFSINQNYHILGILTIQPTWEIWKKKGPLWVYWFQQFRKTRVNSKFQKTYFKKSIG